ncbi:hypothetical protein KJ557_03670 [Patescibacteria group bacterium]|nr:hypothetical protein [Patescibacteria group bacterium]MBU2009989.1 hypothetical protein [Patescibacteria group bacterium]
MGSSPARSTISPLGCRTPKWRKENFLIKVDKLFKYTKPINKTMPEKVEKGPTPENLEEQKRREWQVSMDEENRVLAEVNKVFDSTPDRAEAEKIVIEKWAPLMDETMKKSSEALNTWFDAMREDYARMKKELDDTEKDLGKE